MGAARTPPSAPMETRMSGFPGIGARLAATTSPTSPLESCTTVPTGNRPSAATSIRSTVRSAGSVSSTASAAIAPSGSGGARPGSGVSRSL